MPNNNLLSKKENFIRSVQSLLVGYKKKELSGICFKLDKNKSPLDVVGVLDFLKYKIKKWGSDNIFSYLGALFGEDIMLVIGARNIEDAISMILTVFLSNINDYEDIFDDLYVELENNEEIEQYLRRIISRKIKKGYPNHPVLEAELKSHLKKLLKD
jgi:hypothetical protein